MNARFGLIAAALLLVSHGSASAQSDPHHPAGTPAPQMQGQTGSPQQMQAMMQMMQGCMAMMQAMPGMQGMPMQGGMGENMPMQGKSDASTAYMGAIAKMEMPMMQAVKTADSDVAFVQAMIPHHQGAIDMATAALQFGKDQKVKAWANQIIAAQEKELAEMEAWLAENAQ